MNHEALKGRYDQLLTLRNPYLDRARECAKLTIPSLMPLEGHTGSTKLTTPYQALGARGVNNLAAKLLLALLPPNSPFFRLQIDDFMLEKLTQKEGMRSAVEEALNRIERSVMNQIETSALRTGCFEALKQLLVTGNVLLFLPPEGGLKVFRLDRYVSKRDPMGNILEIVTRENISPMELPEGMRMAVQEKARMANRNPEDSVEVYTQVLRTETKWEIRQEVDGFPVQGSEGSYPLDKNAWIALRFIAIDGEDYGRGFVEEYLGDLKSLEGLTKAIVQAAAAASKVLFLVKPNSTTKHDVLTKSESGDVREGNSEDVTVLQMDKYGDFRVAKEMTDALTRSLSFSFLLNTAIQRSGERVTAEEVRYMANELEASLGGVYSTLSQEFQLPLVVRIMHQMERQGKLPPLPKGVVKPAITTGIEAIGRGNDLTKLAGLLQDIAPLGPQVIQANLKANDFIRRCGVARGIDMKGLIPTAEEVAEAQEEAQMMQMAEKLGPQAINQIGGAARESMAAE